MSKKIAKMIGAYRNGVHEIYAPGKCEIIISKRWLQTLELGTSGNALISHSIYCVLEKSCHDDSPSSLSLPFMGMVLSTKQTERTSERKVVLNMCRKHNPSSIWFPQAKEKTKQKCRMVDE